MKEFNSLEPVSRWREKNHDQKEFLFPVRATKSSVGYDVFLQEEAIIPKEEHRLIPTFLKWRHEGEENRYLRIVGRSSNYKRKLYVLEGTIDADYCDNENNEGEIFISVINYGTEDVVLPEGDRIAQVILSTFETMSDDRATNETRKGGFGSSGN